MRPKRCSHLRSRKIRESQWVYGTPGRLYAQYVCDRCGVYWDDPTEQPPPMSNTWNQITVKGNRIVKGD